MVKENEIEKKLFETLSKSIHDMIVFHSNIFANFIRDCNNFQSNSTFENYDIIKRAIDIHKANNVIINPSLNKIKKCIMKNIFLIDSPR